MPSPHSLQPTAYSPYSPSRSRAAFTAAEMLIVVLIISLLIMILVPSVRLVQHRMERARAAADANALVQAVMHYQQVYGDWPLPAPLPVVANGPLIAGTNANIVLTSTGVQAPISLASVLDCLSPRQDNPANPRQILFLTLPTNSICNGELVDPWGNSYVLIMGAQSVAFPYLPGLSFSNLSAFAISSGPPSSNQSNPSNWVFSAGVRP